MVAVKEEAGAVAAAEVGLPSCHLCHRHLPCLAAEGGTPLQVCYHTESQVGGVGEEEEQEKQIWDPCCG